MFAAFTPQPIRLIELDGTPTGPLPDLDDAFLLRIYQNLWQARRFDERLVLMLRQGLTSFYVQASGMEATQVGLGHAIRAGIDWVWHYYRDQALALTLGVPVEQLLWQMMGSRLDRYQGRQMPHHFGSLEQRMVPPSSSIANQVPPATGCALAQKYLGLDEITVCTFGDGATSEGDWHAGLNMAAVQEAPILFVCENNQWAISAPLSQQSHSLNIAIKAQSYGIDGYYVDGQDVLAVYAVCQQAADQIRHTGKPVLVECLTYRYGSHSSADDDSQYRNPHDVAYWKQQDPIARYGLFLQQRGLLPSPQAQAEAEHAWQQQMQNAIEQAMDYLLPNGALLCEQVFAEKTPLLSLQAQDIQRDLENL